MLEEMMRRFFSNKSINRMYIHSSLFNLAERIGWIFGPIFLIKVGYSIPQVFCMWACLFMIRLPARYIFLKILPWTGLVRSAIMGLTSYIIALTMLPLLRDDVSWLAPFLLFYSIGMTFYWTSYHTMFGMLGDQKDRGKQVAMLSSISLLLMAFEPYISSMIIHFVGYQALFAASAVLMALAVLPLLGISIKTPVFQSSHSKAQRDACRWVAAYHAFCSFKEYGHPFLWRLIVFFMLADIMKFGAALTGGLLFLAAIQLFIGDAVDRGRGYLLLKIGTVVTLIQVFVRALLITTPVGVAMSEGLSVGGKLMTQVEANFYNRGKDAENYFYYIYWAEVAWDIGAMTTLLTMASMAWVGFTLTQIMMIITPFGLIGFYFVNAAMDENKKRSRKIAIPPIENSI
jgi:MFS family permease